MKNREKNGDAAASVAERSYIAFISYRHTPLDREAAELIQKKIENYIVLKEFRELAGGRKLGMVFRDEDELPASSSLSRSITEALDHTKYLIVICSPDLPLSKWCEQEIRYFLQTHDRDHVLAVLADGTPEVSFSPLLLHTFDEEGNITGDTEPLAANIAGRDHKLDRKALKKEIVRIYAALLGVPFDSLWQREKRARQRRFMAVLSVLSLVMVVFLGVILNKNAQIMRQNREITEQSTQITEQNRQITEQNTRISEQNLSLQRQMSSMQVDSGQTKLASFDRIGALESALEALGEGDPDIYDHRAEKLLADTLGTYEYDELRSSIIYEQPTGIASLKVTEDRNLALIADRIGYVRCIDAHTGALQWEAPSWAEGGETGDRFAEVFPAEDAGTVICINRSNICGLSLEDGSMRWNRIHKTSNYFRALSPDKSRLAVMDFHYYKEDSLEADHEVDIVLLDTKTGEEKGRVTLGDGVTELSYPPYHWYSCAADFSDSGKLLACAFYEKPVGSDGEPLYKYYLIDTEQLKTTREGSCHYSGDADNLFYGIWADDETESMFCAQYSISYGGILTTRFDGRTGEVTTVTTAQTISSSRNGTIIGDIELDVVPMLASGSLAAVFTEDTLHLFDMTDCRQVKSFQMSGDIVHAYWIDRDREILCALLSSGDVAAYDFEHGGDQFLASYEITTGLDQTDIRLAAVVDGGAAGPYQDGKAGRTGTLPDAEEYGQYLTVRQKDPGCVLKVERRRDRASEPVPDQPDTFASYTGVMETPSGQRVITAYKNGEVLTLCAYDAKTHRELERAQFGDVLTVYTWAMTAMDDSHVLMRGTIFGLDGSREFMEAITEDNSYHYGKTMMHSMTSEGHVLSVSDQTDNKYQAEISPVWLDGKLVDAAREGKTGLLLADGEIYEPGSNGYVAGRGRPFTEDPKDPAYLIAEEESRFVSFRAKDGRRIFFEDACPEADRRLAALGTESPVMAVAYGNGKLYLYDLDDGKPRELDAAYTAGEIRLLRFVPGDRYLAILTNTGRLDLTDTKTGHLVWSGYSDYVSDRVQYMDRLGCTQDTKTGRIYLTVGYAEQNNCTLFCVDPSSRTTAELIEQYTYGRLAADRCIYTSCGNVLIRTPEHDLEDLKAWAREELTAAER